MNFRPRAKEEPEINLIPFIDVLLVILIFLMLTTTYSKFTELQLTLPVADAEQQRDHPKEVIVSVAADGRYAINKTGVDGKSVDAIAQALRGAALPPPASGLQKIWQTRGPLAWVLWPVSRVYRTLVGMRRGLYRIGLLKAEHPGRPVIVVGNVIAGGAGKTPGAIADVQHLQGLGL